MNPQPQMDVLYMKDYLHVLGMFTRNAEPTQIEATADAFVGDGFHLRGLSIGGVVPNPGQDFIVPANLIGIYPAGLNPAQLSTPLTLYADPPSAPTEAKAFIQPDVVTVSVSGLGVASLSLVPIGGGGPVPFPNDADALVLVEGGATPTQVPFKIPASSASPFSLSLPPLNHGTYFLVAFVLGYPIVASASFTV